MTEASRDLPKGWRWARLGEVCHAQSGGTPRRGVSEYYGGDVPWAKIEDLTRAGMYIAETEEVISQSGLQNSSARVFPPGTVLFAMYGSIGTSSITRVPMATNQAILGCICDRHIVPEFLWHWFQLQRDALLRTGRGGTQANVNARMIKELSIPLPPIDDQRRIVEWLEERMAAVERAKAALQQGRAAAAALPSALLRQVFPKPGDPLPKGWRWARLGDLAEYINGRAFKPAEWVTSGLPIIRIQNLTDGAAPFNHFQGEVEPRYLVANGDLLISWSASLDAFIWERGPAVLNQHIFKVVENTKLTLREFLFYAVQSVIAEIRSQVHGATMRHITKPEFEAIRIPLAPLSVQRRIVEWLEERMAAVERANQMLEEQRQALETVPQSLLKLAFSGGV